MISQAPKIHDTTLRDGEQMPGVALNPDEKMALAERIIGFGVDIIDIMPAVSAGEMLVTKRLCREFGRKVSATCRAMRKDIDIAISSGAERVTLFSPLSDIHIEEKLRISRDENIRRSLEMIDYARSHGIVVDFAGEDSTRADTEYFREFVGSVEGKVESFFVADTVGCLTPRSAGNIIRFLKREFSCPIGIHAHNDFGMATANTIEAALAGADYLSGTFTGIGERAGNAAIEEVCIALKELHGVEMGVRYGDIKGICDMVQSLTGVRLQGHKPVVGENAFSHESGIHVDGILKNPRTYESFSPETVGHERKICIGKHSGRKGVERFLSEHLAEGKLDQEEIRKLLGILKGMRGKGPSSEQEVEKVER